MLNINSKFYRVAVNTWLFIVCYAALQHFHDNATLNIIVYNNNNNNNW